MTIPQALDLAFQRLRAGRLAEAEALFHQILAAQPNQPDALHLLGCLASQAGRHDRAADLIRQAIAVNPADPNCHVNLGNALVALGRLDEAIATYGRALRLQPDLAIAHNNLGSALRNRGDLDEAITAYRRALQIDPGYTDAHSNLGVALQETGRWDEAVAACRHAIRLKPDHIEAWYNLGITLRSQGHLDEAMGAYRRALQIRPDHVKALNNLGSALKDQGHLEESIVAHRQALQLKPDYVEACINLGNALRDSGDLQESMALYRRALQLKPDCGEAHLQLGNSLRLLGKLDEAIAAFRRALQVKPDFPDALNNLGNALKDQGNLDEAVAAYRHALQLEPGFTEALNNLGNALKDRGNLDEAITAYRHALQIKPEDSSAHSNLIYTLHLPPGQDARTIAEEHQRWNRQFSDPLKQFLLPHTNDPSPERRLRVGYVSPDFCEHPVGRLILPLLENHDRDRFEILCYSGAARSGPMTARLRALTGTWRSTIGIPDARLAGMIREDGVDILVDLALHTAGNRLPMFARQPAPVQVSWLGYPGSAGLQGIGYRLTDARLEPPGEEPACSAEEPVRLPDCWACFQPVDEFPEVNALPASSAKSVTFGSLNNFAKMNEGVLAFWARVLKAVKGSRLMMLCPEGHARKRILAFFGAQGIGADRVELVGFAPRLDYLRLYQRIDIALDPFPYNGMTTTCEALWMGLPVVTLPGAMPVSRTGLSVLSSVGLGELAASSEDDYVRIAAELAGNLPRLAELRASMRARLLASPLMDAPRFARNVEAAYRSMWQAWRRKQSPTRER